MLSLGGVAPKSNGTMPIALEQFLHDSPQIQTLYLHLDNDPPGRTAAAALSKSLSRQFRVLDCPPSAGKDVNDQLMMESKKRNKEDFCR